MPNPLRQDPTRTTGLRRRWLADLARRIAKLKAAIRQLVVADDAFGLDKPPGPSLSAVLTNADQRWRFQTDAAKILSFQQWLQGEVNAGLLQTDAAGQPWTTPYVVSAYKQGAVRAYTDANAAALAPSPDFYAGSRAQFLDDAFNTPEAVSKLQLIATRPYEQLKGVSAEVSAKLSSGLASGLAHGQGPHEIAREMLGDIDGLDRRRARAIARTEIIHAHAEGQLDGFEALGIEEVGVMAEWATAGDDHVCPMCAALEGAIFSVDEARGLIPRHPNCRCTWLPADVGESKKAQVRRADKLRAAIARSARAERPKAPNAKAALAQSRWAGADVKPRSK